MEDAFNAASTEVMDEGDMASAYQMRENAAALAKTRAATAPESHPDFDGESCLDCGSEIPAARLAMGRIRCVGCQSALERKNKLFAVAG